MNLDRVIKTESWQSKAADGARTAFISNMVGRSYGASETLDAWLWFYSGWRAHVSFRIVNSDE